MQQAINKPFPAQPRRAERIIITIPRSSYAQKPKEKQPIRRCLCCGAPENEVRHD